MAWRLLLEQAVDPKKGCTAFLQDGTYDKVVLAVKKGMADEGTVRSDTMARMESEGVIQMQDFRIINWIEDGYLFVHSTRLYPQWQFAVCYPQPTLNWHKRLPKRWFFSTFSMKP